MILDEVDLKILELLQENGRLSHTAIGNQIGLTGPSVYSRVQRLERDGVIKGYAALLDAEKVGRGLAAFVRVGTLASADIDSPFEQFVLNEPQIIECHDVDGEDSYILKVRTSSPQTLRTLLARLRSIPGVTRTITSISLITIKEPGTAGLLVVDKPEETNKSN
ncbi:MAG TPA: Lrp/AsnC family transcriptional regulator [Chloroflexia bacterium]|nr:Lrp/AsnC family transcriptional regulator [Chloroflexia bacterium]